MFEIWPYRLLPLLAIPAIVMAVSVVYLKHQQRVVHSELYRLRAVNEELLLNQSQLLLESSTLASYNRVETLAHDTLRMRAPEAWEVLWLHSE